MSGTRSLNEQDLHDNLAFSRSCNQASTHEKMDTTPNVSILTPLITSLQVWYPNNRNSTLQKEKGKKGVGYLIINIHYYIHLEGGDQQVDPNPNPHLQRN